MSVEMNLVFLHEITGSGLMRHCSSIINGKYKWGFGGIATIGEGKVFAEGILSEHYLCGSQLIILGRAFHKNANNLIDLKNNNFEIELNKLKKFWDELDSHNVNKYQVLLHDQLTRLRNEIILNTF